MRRATIIKFGVSHTRLISIHALHEESDSAWQIGSLTQGISIHALHEESDRSVRWTARPTTKFQSTLSMRRATAFQEDSNCPTLFQSTLSMRRATWQWLYDDLSLFISIHALHEESDVTQTTLANMAIFQSTLSMRRATNGSMRTIDSTLISIHALHEESDSAAGHFCPLFETQASCLALSISNNTADTTNNMSKTSNWLSVSF